MAPRPPASDDPSRSDADDPELKKKPVAASGPPVPAGTAKPAAAPADEADDEEEDEDDELDDDDDDEDLVVFTAKEAAGALSTIFGFVRPLLANYRKPFAFVSFGVLVETLFNVIMPLSLKFLIDDALGEEDFQALYKILGVLAVAGIITSIIAVWYERWDARLAAGSSPTSGRASSSMSRTCRRLISRAPSAARSCRASRSICRPSKARSRPSPTARRCRSSS
jgi:ATP-binding cassette subfamily B protein